MEERKSTSFLQFVKVEDCDTFQDFNGSETNFSLDKQLDFLKKLSDFNEKKYGECDKPLVTEKECVSALNNISLSILNERRKREYFKNVTAYLEYQKESSKCVLYTKKSILKENTIIFNDGDNYPTPCAKIQVQNDISYAEFIVDMGKQFQSPLRGGVDTMVPGRVIEFRKGVKEILKIQFYSDGTCYARLGVTDEWHHKNVFLSKVDYSNRFTLSVLLNDKKATIVINGKSVIVDLLSTEFPNTVFMGGGMCIANTWKITPTYIRGANGENINVFSDNKNCEVVKERIGEIDLPYVIGTERNQDKKLVVEKKYVYSKDDEDVFLHCSTIDPDGEVYVNEKKVADVNSTTSQEMNITDFLAEGENVISITVNPRAPEILYSWHKHKDPYNGWFIGETYLEKRTKTFIKSVKIKTANVSRLISGNLAFDIENKDEQKVLLKYYVSDENGEIELGENVFYGDKVNVPFKFKGVEWTCNNPHLYDFTAKLFINGRIVDEYKERIGFRTIEQKKGSIYLNGEKIILKGVLLMQFLPPYEEIPLNHLCPKDKQIVWQALIAKKMGCNTIRMHQLGYGTNDQRFAKIFDALGLCVIWTTRMIDSVQNVPRDGKWKQKEYYQKQIEEVYNHPSIIMWEGANEIYIDRQDTDMIYSEFVGGVKEVDDTRLICPVSHLYYANDSYNRGCEYYQDDGKKDEYFKKANACKEWTDELVVRSAHTYDWLLGYGKGWDKFRLQDWSAQKSLLKSKKHAYIISEYAVIGRQNPDHNISNKQSYELNDEKTLGYNFNEKEWKLSQAYQSLTARFTTKYMLCKGVDGMLWCSLNGGANDGTYLKPPVDVLGYPKQAFYALKECFADTVCFDADCDAVWGKSKIIKPILLGNGNEKPKSVKISIYNENDVLVKEKVYGKIGKLKNVKRLPKWKVSLPTNAYYYARFAVYYG